MNKAFTKEDDDAGFAPPSTARSGGHVGPIRLTATGARLLSLRDGAGTEALSRAQVLAPLRDPERAALGVTVRVRRGYDAERRYRLVSAEERALLDDGCSIEGPLGRALLGARPGDVVELETPRGVEEIEVVALDGEEAG